MTFVMGVLGKKSIWLMADWRLSYPNSHKDTGSKMLEIAGTDGVALLGYAGLGATKNAQPSEWLNDVVSGHMGGTVEAYLGLIADAVKSDLPKHLKGIGSHDIMIPAIVDGKPRIYGIGLALGQPGEENTNLYTRYVPGPRIAFAGSGIRNMPPVKGWFRDLLRLVSRFEKGDVAPTTVADFMAGINAQVAANDKTVSPGCTVIWRRDGGAHQFYDATGRCMNGPPIGAVTQGTDILKLVGATTPFFLPSMKESLETGQHVEPDFTADEINEAIRKAFDVPKREL